MSEYICPHCQRPIYDDEALLCLYCGEGLRRGFGFTGGLKYIRPRTIVILLILLVLLAFLLLILR